MASEYTNQQRAKRNKCLSISTTPVQGPTPTGTVEDDIPEKRKLPYASPTSNGSNMSECSIYVYLGREIYLALSRC